MKNTLFGQYKPSHDKMWIIVEKTCIQIDLVVCGTVQFILCIYVSFLHSRQVIYFIYWMSIKKILLRKW